MSLLTLLRGLWLLRKPDLVRRLGELWRDEERLAALRRQHPGARISSGVLFEGLEHGRMQLGDGAAIETGSLIVFGDALNGYGSLSIGSGTWIGQYNNFRLGGDATITIGDDCLVSQFCSIVAVNHDLRRDRRMRNVPVSRVKTGVNIGSDVWLGAGAVVLPGTNIGDGAVIGANAVVSGDVPPYEIWAGVPARRVGART